jgi:Fe2+ or Zn2+ uptake regulation protein
MKAVNYLFMAVALTTTLLLVDNLLGFVGKAQSSNAATACNLLKQLSQNSNDWAEVVAYKNAFEFAKARVTQRSSIAESERYFHDLIRRNSGQTIVFCMSLNREPLRDCGFRNNETQDSILELIQRKMERDRLSVDDIYNAINNAQPRRGGTEYRPFNRQ